jgi:hypothetical protein
VGGPIKEFTWILLWKVNLYLLFYEFWKFREYHTAVSHYILRFRYLRNWEEFSYSSFLLHYFLLNKYVKFYVKNVGYHI